MLLEKPRSERCDGELENVGNIQLLEAAKVSLPR